MKLNFLKNEYFLGLFIFFLPLLLFFKPQNWKQLYLFDYYLIFLSQIIILFIFYILKISVNFIISKYFKININSFFIVLCFGFYLLFLYDPIYDFAATNIYKQGGASYFSIIIIFILWLVIFFFVGFFKTIEFFFKRILLIFVFMNIVVFISSNIFYFLNFPEINKNNKIINLQNKINKDEIKKIKSSNQKNNHNIYYFILDEMMDLELAEKNNIINKDQIINSFKKFDLKYIDLSYSSYNETYLTLASFFEIDYPVTEKSQKYINRRNFFPLMMYQEDKTVFLPELINKIGNEFIWIGNFFAECLEIINQSWSCINSNLSFNFMRLSSTFYYNTPIESILIGMLASDNFTKNNSKEVKGQRNINNLIEYLKSNKIDDSEIAKFFFVHQLSPHFPYNVDKKCKKKYNHKSEYEGYKSSYLCVLKEITKFINFISIADPEAIIVFQGDHGVKWVPTEKKEEKILYRARIFNAIKAPQICFEKHGDPKTTVNTIRFVLNCAYGFNLKQKEIKHYTVFQEKDILSYGKVIKHNY